MKITKATREQAALICAISASWKKGDSAWYWLIGEEIGASREAITLAAEALCETPSDKRRFAKGRYWHRKDDAEAEALLRTGWTP